MADGAYNYGDIAAKRQAASGVLGAPYGEDVRVADAIVAREAEVTREFNRVNAVLLCANELIARLIDRCSPVMRPAGPEAESTKLEEAQSVSTAIGAELRSISVELGRRCKELQYAIDRLEL